MITTEERIEMITNEPIVSREHLIAVAQKCNLLTGYRTQEMVDAIVGYAYVVLNDKAVQEAFIRANPRPVLDTLTQEISAMKQHCVEARQALDINDFSHCAYEIDAALKVGASSTAHCRTDGRCQYAIDHGAEGLGHCPPGKCCMPDNT